MNYSKKFKDKLTKLGGVIAETLLNEEGTGIIDYLDIAVDNPKKVSFLDKARITKYENETIVPEIGTYFPCTTTKVEKIEDGFINETWSLLEFNAVKMYYSKIRYMSSPAKILNKLFPKRFPQKEVDAFIAAWYGDLLDMEEENFLIADEFDYWYYWKNYKTQGGQLGESCLRYRNHQGSTFGIFNDNKNIHLAVKHENKKTVARAIIWEGKYFDRIYAITNSEEKSFRTFLEKKGFENIYGTGKSLSVKLEHTDYDYYPFMDTMQFLDGKTLSSTNSDGKSLRNHGGRSKFPCTCGVEIEKNHQAADHKDYYCEKCLEKATLGKWKGQKIKDHIKTSLGEVIHVSEVIKFEEKICYEGDVVTDVEGVRRWKEDCTLIKEKYHLSLYTYLKNINVNQKEQEEIKEESASMDLSEACTA